jgi:gliding motility-associated-like protein
VAVEIFDSPNGCTTTRTSKLVQVFGTITASVTSTVACDDGKPFLLTATTNAPSPTYEWSLNSTKIIGATKDTTHQTSEGIYKVKIQQGSCKDSTSIQIVKAPLPIGALKIMYQICSDPDNNVDSTKYAILRPGKTFTGYDWFEFGAAGYFSLGINADTLKASNAGKYRVDLTNVFGCVNSDFTEIINDCEPIIAGPNAFHPASSHSENNVFQLFTFYISNFEVIVFNRWGETVYESKDDKFKWNGGYNNNASQPLPGGTYTYLVRYISTFHPDRGTQEVRRGVVLLR